MNYLSKLNSQANPENALKYISQDHYEKFHLKFIKWALSVHSKSSNIGCWGESGRYPLFYEACKLAIDYYTRLKNTNNKLLSAAFKEQVALDLPWYKNLSKLLDKYKPTTEINPKIKLSCIISNNMRIEFVDMWNSAKATSPKLEFYHLIKTNFQPEKYLSIINVPDFRKNLTKLRISSHNLYVERGRYQIPYVSRENRWCVHCFYNLGTKYIEDETHVLVNCPLYSTTRKNLTSIHMIKKPSRFAIKSQP